MGTVVSLRGATPTAATAVQAVFAAYDRCYSLWDAGSVLSRIASGALRLSDAPEEVRDTYALALSWRDRTGGAFTPHRPDGVLDLSGIVKAMAIRDAGELLDRVGSASASASGWMISAGGDVLVRGRHGALVPDDPWRVGIVDPADRNRVVGIVDLDRRRAVATSGTAERGDHIWRRAAPVFTQATVIADDIVTADVLATAVIGGDEGDLARLTADGSVDVVAFAVDGAVWATPGAAGALSATVAETTQDSVGEGGREARHQLAPRLPSVLGSGPDRAGSCARHPMMGSGVASTRPRTNVRLADPTLAVKGCPPSSRRSAFLAGAIDDPGHQGRAAQHDDGTGKERGDPPAVIDDGADHDHSDCRADRVCVCLQAHPARYSTTARLRNEGLLQRVQECKRGGHDDPQCGYEDHRRRKSQRGCAHSSRERSGEIGRFPAPSLDYGVKEPRKNGECDAARQVDQGDLPDFEASTLQLQQERQPDTCLSCSGEATKSHQRREPASMATHPAGHLSSHDERFSRGEHQARASGNRRNGKSDEDCRVTEGPEKDHRWPPEDP